MKSNFEIDQTIALESGEQYLDLHNCFDFVGYQYQPKEKRIQCEWKKTIGDWVSPELPEKVYLDFEGVSNFAAQKREDEIPFSEDDCLSSISFLPKELNEEFDAVCPDFRSADEHISLSFQSGSCIKIWADSVTLETKQAEPVATVQRR